MTLISMCSPIGLLVGLTEVSSQDLVHLTERREGLAKISFIISAMCHELRRTKPRRGRSERPWGFTHVDELE